MTISTDQILFDTALRHHQQGRLGDARIGYQKVLLQNAGHADALHMLGVLMHQTGDRSEQPIRFVQRAISLNPAAPEYFCNLGLILGDLQRWPDAAAAFGRAVALRPDYAVAHNHLGTALRTLGKLDESAASYRRAVSAKPDFADAWNNLGNVLREMNRFEESADACRRAILVRPDFAAAHNNLGNALLRQDMLEEAVVEYRRAFLLDPGNAKILSNIGNALKDLGLLDEALAAYRDALVLDPNLHECHSNLLYYSHYREGFDPIASLRGSREWAWRHARQYSRVMAGHSNIVDARRRLVIGYVSPDFRSHAVASFLLPLLQNHDHQQFEVIAYSNVRAGDRVTQSIRQLVDQWRDITAISDEQAADLVRKDGVDILVDLAGHTAQSRLLMMARHPAPVQISYLGYPGTTGLHAIDYKLTDALADPPGMTEAHFNESLLRLPRTNWCFAPIAEASAVAALPAMNASGAVCFGSFNNFAKITPGVVETWAKVLLAVPGSRLMIKAKPLGSPNICGQITRRLGELGISPERLDLRGRLLNLGEHFATYNQIDIALDTFPYNGTTTTCEALWMGVPVVALAGDAHLSRVGVSLLTNIGLDELIANSPEQYVRIAARLAGDLPKLAEMRGQMRQRMTASALTDGAALARDVEMQYRTVWRRWCDGSLGTERLHRAVEHYRQLTAMHPEDAESRFNLASARYFLGQTDDAVADFQMAQQLSPGKVEIMANLGSALQARGEIEPAIALFRQATQLKPRSPEAHYNLALALLLVGQYAEGWREYEWRLALAESTINPRPPKSPRWDGSSLDGRTLFLYAEQGMGDTIQFLRYVPDVVRRGGRVLLVVRRELEPFLQGSNAQGAEVVSRFVVGSRPIDAHLPMMSLPLVLGMREPPTMSAPYLRALTPWPWRDELNRASGLKVGLVWAGNPHHKGDRQRSLPLASLTPLAGANATFFSLQMGFPAEQSAGAPMPLVDLTGRLKDFADTAALIAELDLVITVDTAMAHLAGAMGKETWILLPFAPDWRWMLERTDSPWYPTARLYRQTRAGDWQAPVVQVAAELHRRCNAR